MAEFLARVHQRAAQEEEWAARWSVLEQLDEEARQGAKKDDWEAWWMHHHAFEIRITAAPDECILPQKWDYDIRHSYWSSWDSDY